MTTTISIPQELGEQITRTAQTLGVSQSNLLAVAIREYIFARELDARAELAGIESIRELTKNDTW